MKKSISKAEWGVLDPMIQALYVATDSGYSLDLEDDDVGPLKRAKDREVERRKEAEKRLREYEEELEKFRALEESKESEKAKKAGDIEAIEKSWQDKYERLKTTKEKEVERYKQHLTHTLVDKTAAEIAAEISVSPRIMERFVRDRLMADFDGDVPKTRVLDADGNPSALTVDELKQEFLQNEEFSSILVASRASGGANVDSVTPGGGAPSSSTGTDLNSLSPEALTEYISSKIKD